MTTRALSVDWDGTLDNTQSPTFIFDFAIACRLRCFQIMPDHLESELKISYCKIGHVDVAPRDITVDVFKAEPWQPFPEDDPDFWAQIPTIVPGLHVTIQLESEEPFPKSFTILCIVEEIK